MKVSGYCQKSFALTVIELLVVIGILGVLIAIILPVVRVATTHSRQTACIAKIRALGNAIFLYQAEHQQRLPPNKTDNPGITTENVWGYVIAPYFGISTTDKTIITREMQKHLSCPETERLSPDKWQWWYADYGANAAGDHVFGYKGASNLPTITKPKDTMMLLETKGRARAARPTANLSKNIEFRHSGRMNIIYFDGHVESLEESEVPTGWSAVFWSGDTE